MVGVPFVSGLRAVVMRYRQFADSFVNQQGLQFRRIGQDFTLGQGGDIAGEDR